MMIYDIGWKPAASAKMLRHIANTGSHPGNHVTVPAR